MKIALYAIGLTILVAITVQMTAHYLDREHDIAVAQSLAAKNSTSQSESHRTFFTSSAICDEAEAAEEPAPTPSEDSSQPEERVSYDSRQPSTLSN